MQKSANNIRFQPFMSFPAIWVLKSEALDIREHTQAISCTNRKFVVLWYLVLWYLVCYVTSVTQHTSILICFQQWEKKSMGGQLLLTLNLHSKLCLSEGHHLSFVSQQKILKTTALDWVYWKRALPLWTHLLQ